MTVDDFTIHLPPHVRPEFVAWLAKRDAQTGLDCDTCGYRHPITREHCTMCGSASLFPHGVHRDHRTLNI